PWFVRRQAQGECLAQPPDPAELAERQAGGVRKQPLQLPKAHRGIPCDVGHPALSATGNDTPDRSTNARVAIGSRRHRLADPAVEGGERNVWLIGARNDLIE